MIPGLAPNTRRVLGYVRDALIILGIAVGGMYVLDHPEKLDDYLSWLLGRP